MISFWKFAAVAFVTAVGSFAVAAATGTAPTAESPGACPCGTACACVECDCL